MRRNLQGPTIYGRQGELAQLRELLAGSGSVVTLTGPGGVGKSAIVQNFAASAADLADQVVVVELSGVHDEGAMRDAVLAALDDPTSPRESYAEVCRNRLRSRRTLLVFDGADHVSGGVNALLTLLDPGDGELRVIITRRRPLGSRDEVVLAVRPLPVPTLTAPTTVDALLSLPSCQLLMDRVRDRVRDWRVADGDVAHIVSIARGTAGNPLAIELVASRIPFLGFAAVAERIGPLLLGRRPDAERADVHEAIEWAIGQLPPVAIRLLSRLARTRGPLTLPSIEHLYLDTEDHWATASDLLVLLAESGLMAFESIAETHAYVLPEAVRAYVVDHVAAEPTEVCATRWYHQLAVEAGARSGSTRRASCDRTLEIERLNVLDGLARSLEYGSVRETAEAVVALFEHWCAKGELRDAKVWLQRAEQALRSTEDESLDRLRDQVAINFCMLDVYTSPKPQSEHLAREVLTRARQRGDTALEGRALYQCASFAASRKEFHLARQYLQSSTECFREHGSQFDLAVNLYFQASVHVAEGLDEDALDFALTAAESFRQLDEPMMETTSRHLAAILLIRRRDLDEATRQLQLVVGGVDRSRYLVIGPSILFLGAAACAMRGDAFHAAELLAAARTHLHPVEGFAMHAHVTARFTSEMVGPLLSQLDPDKLAAASAAGERLTLPAAVARVGQVLSATPDEYLTQLARTHADSASAQAVDALASLSAREREVLAHVAAGASNEAVALALDLSRRTVDKHLERIFRKLGVRTRTAATRILLDAQGGPA